jgi:prepilin signal peptidase PulO-like enzyme (type II secretory pathway)
MFGYPLALVVNPASKGSCYARTSTLLSAVVLITTMMLYVVVATFPLLYLWEVFQLNEPVVEFVLLAYLVFFATAIVIHVMGEVMLWILIKPLWSYMAKKSHYD